MVFCLLAANLQIPGFAWKQVADWPRRVTHNAEMIVAGVRGRSDGLYAECRDPEMCPCSNSIGPEDVIGSESVDVMNYLLLAMVNGLNYRPRPIIRDSWHIHRRFRASMRSTSAAPGRPHFVMLCQQTTDGRLDHAGRFRHAELRAQQLHSRGAGRPLFDFAATNRRRPGLPACA